MSKRCITTNSTIEELAAKLQGETIESVKGLVELWQDKNNKDWDTYPTASELNNFRVELRRNTPLFSKESVILKERIRVLQGLIEDIKKSGLKEAAAAMN